MSRSSRATHGGPRALDVAAFCRDAARIEGQWPMLDLPRLAESVRVGDDGFVAAPVDWVATGRVLDEQRAAPHCLIDLEIQTRVVLECQRCLQPMAVPIHVQRRFRFVEGEDEAARLDEELDDDVLALTPRLDLRALVEDELLLALPLVPRHEACPDLPAALRPSEEAVPEAPSATTTPEHPFAALAALRRAKG